MNFKCKVGDFRWKWGDFSDFVASGPPGPPRGGARMGPLLAPPREPSKFKIVKKRQSTVIKEAVIS